MNSFGRLFRISIYGESHTEGIGMIIDGCPAGIEISTDDFLFDVERRKTGQVGTSPRKESDTPTILSGVFQNHTTGSPVNIFFENNNVNSKDYSFINSTPRPGHSDLVAKHKYFGYNDFRGGGAFSGRLTLALVAAGVIAKKIIKDITIDAKIISLRGNSDINSEVQIAINNKDSVGGIIECRADGIQIGLGEPFFDSIESIIAHLAFSIPGVIGIEFGKGFAGTNLFGSEFNDRYTNSDGHTVSNNSGGINGGISNGNELVFRVAVKPTSSIAKTQETYNFVKKEIDSVEIKGRHDSCFALRVPPVIEAITAIALADFSLIRNSQLNRISNT